MTKHGRRGSLESEGSTYLVFDGDPQDDEEGARVDANSPQDAAERWVGSNYEPGWSDTPFTMYVTTIDRERQWKVTVSAKMKLEIVVSNIVRIGPEEGDASHG